MMKKTYNKQVTAIPVIDPCNGFVREEYSGVEIVGCGGKHK
jgi:hypothetical protein